MVLLHKNHYTLNHAFIYKFKNSYGNYLKTHDKLNRLIGGVNIFLGSLFYYKIICDITLSNVPLIYGIRRQLIGVGSITEVKQRRTRFIIGWVTAWDCQVLYTRGAHVNQMARPTDLELDVK